jgi:tetratricopeptide (TPR) repeat protein
MSFQGDVAGIGLGELLQGLSRGGREGILTLHGSGLSATLGIVGAQIHLLPDPDEDPEYWRRRCERAWAKDPNERIDVLRMAEIAKAERTENFFRILDSTGIHFRFEQGEVPTTESFLRAAQAKPIPTDGAGSEGNVPLNIPVYCPPVSVEYLLLEYARLGDEAGGVVQAKPLAAFDVPCQAVAQEPAEGLRKLFAECDSKSTLLEISDRLGWPLRQTRTLAQQLLLAGYLQCAGPMELLLLAQQELSNNNFARAAARIAGWTLSSDMGPLPAEQSSILASEWLRGKLPACMASMEARVARHLLRKLDLADPRPEAAIQRWTEFGKYHKHDFLGELRLLHWQVRSNDEGLLPAATDFLKLARRLQEDGRPWRAGIVLREAAARLPETTSSRLEIGQRMLSAGLVSEGAHWILEGCRDLIESGNAEKAIGPLRAILGSEPEHREARALYSLARSRSATGRRARRNAMLALGGVLLLAGVVVLHLHRQTQREAEIEELALRSDDAEKTLSELDLRFPGSAYSSAVELRTQLQARLRDKEKLLREDWMRGFDAAKREVSVGDPVLGLRLALSLTEPPRLKFSTEPFPTQNELLQALAGRLELTVAAWPPALQVEGEALRQEQRLHALVKELEQSVVGFKASDWLSSFSMRIGSLDARLTLRDEERATERERRQDQERVEEQDRLLSAARAHGKAGDLKRSLDNYERLLAIPQSEALGKLLAKEIEAVRSHHEAYLAAVSLSTAGRHKEARAALEGFCSNLREHLMPWRVETVPSGGRVVLPDGGVRTTPFKMESAFGERIWFLVESPGFESHKVELENPADLVVRMARSPTRWWRTQGVVEAVPIDVDHDHVLCDRKGNAVRLGPDGVERWSTKFSTLGGIARAPLFLPKRPGSLLVATEDGEVWILSAADGRVEGPWKSGSTPADGPQGTADGVQIGFRDGRSGLWTGRLEPERIEPIASVTAERAAAAGSDCGMAVLRRRTADKQLLHSPWAPWSVEVGEKEFIVRYKDSDERGYAVRRVGDWVYVAWEAPKAKASEGRLWISDGAGLRAFEPSPQH